MESSQLILDADGVLLDFVAGFDAFMRRRGHKAAIPLHTSRDYNLGDLWPDMPWPDRLALMHQFMADESFSAVPHIEGAYDAVRMIRQEHPGIKISAVTAIGSNPAARAARRANLREFGIEDVTFVPMAGSKADELFRFSPGAVYVDDLPGHVDDGIAAGHRSYLFRQPHNVGTTRLPTLRDWADGINVVLCDLSSPVLEPAF